MADISPDMDFATAALYDIAQAKTLDRAAKLATDTLVELASRGVPVPSLASEGTYSKARPIRRKGEA